MYFFQRIFIVLCILCFAGALLAWGVFSTTQGSNWLLRQAVRVLTKNGTVRYAALRGSLMRGLHYEQLQVAGIAQFPKGSILDARQVFIKIANLSARGITIGVTDGRLTVPEIGTLLLQGALDAGTITAECSAENINIAGLARVVPALELPEAVSGTVAAVQVRGSGRVEQVRIAAAIQSVNIIYGSEAQFSGAVTFDGIWEQGAVQGRARFEQSRLRLSAVPGSEATAQRIEIFLPAAGMAALEVDIFNGGVTIPGADKVLFYGTYADGEYDVTVYSRSVLLNPLLRLARAGGALRDISGIASEFDARIRGGWHEPLVSGTVFLNRMDYEQFTLRDMPLSFELRMRASGVENVLSSGQLVASGGQLSGRRTAVVRVSRSRMIFTGDASDPRFDINATAMVADTRIKIVLTGTGAEPELFLSSEPAATQQELLIMLATNKKWRTTGKTVISRERISEHVAADLLDYFVLGQVGTHIAQQLSLTDFVIHLDRERQGIGVRKDVADRTELRYSIEQSGGTPDKEQVRQRVGADYRVNEILSVGAEKEVRRQGSRDMQTEENRALLKIKKKF
ncbi:MAG: translocation/assembly module TamB [Candidatus Omnitrophica bacterium]|nr:translocation/assembly module TamB [Candidatus Omnitrophota bacterium]